MTDVECYNIIVSKPKKKSEKMLPLYVKTLHKVFVVYICNFAMQLNPIYS